jgi:hypothetical protein
MDGTEDRSPQDTARDGQPEAGEQQKQGLDARSAVTRIGVRVRRPVFASVTGLIAVASLIWLATAHPWTGASGAPGQTAGGHFDRDGLAFDYPADWSLSASGYQMRESTALDFIGTVPALPICTPSGEGMMGANCGVDIHPGAGQILISIFLLDGPGLHSDPINPADPSGLYGSQTYVAVGGLPAIFEDQGAGSDAETLTWTLSVPGQLRQKYSIRAEIRDPGLDQMRTQVMAVVASIRYDPPVPPLNPADGPRIAAIGLAKARAWNSDFNCFPSATGAAVDATVTRLPGYSDLHKSLPVTCSTEIEPVLVGLWKMTLTESWTAASDRSAGSLTTTLWLSADGEPGTEEGGPGPSEIPYWP